MLQPHYEQSLERLERPFRFQTLDFFALILCLLTTIICKRYVRGSMAAYGTNSGFASRITNYYGKK